MVGGVVTTRSACAPSLTLTGNTAPDWKLTVTLWPLARSNMGTSSSRTSRMAVDAMTLISAAFTALAASTALRQPATAVVFDHMCFLRCCCSATRIRRRRYPGSMPSFLNTGSAASEVRNFTSALAGSGCLAVAGSPVT